MNYSKKKYIGGGFPPFKPLNIITDNIDKGSIKKSISITDILKKNQIKDNKKNDDYFLDANQFDILKRYL